jgi:natural product precursor
MKNLKLDKLSSNRFDENELSKINGGQNLCGCTASCVFQYADQGGSPTSDSMYAHGDLALTRTLFKFQY